jgi:hypothetical protein
MTIESLLRAGMAALAAACGLAVVMLLSLPAGQASAATVVGENFSSSDTCSTNVTYLQTRSPGSLYTIPKPGVLTSWTISGPASGTLTAAFKVARESLPGSDTFLLVGSSANHTAMAGSSFTGNLSYRVEAGDVIGLYVTSGASCGFVNPSLGYQLRLRSGEHLSGSATYPNGGDAQLNVSAVLEDDVDGDGLGDESQDSDDDNDGVPDASDNCGIAANPEQANTDGAPDGGNACDADDDNDGAADVTDNCATVANVDQANTDGAPDGGNACDADDDNDGAADVTDNCATVANGGHEDFDQDGVGDACDPPAPGVCTNRHVGTELADAITGTVAGDRVDARGGADTVRGLAGADCLNGGGESDKLFGGNGNDTLTGAGGADKLVGGSGNDKVSGGTDADHLVGGSGKNKYSGGDGNDRIDAVNGNRETIDCGPGTRDRATVDKQDRVKRCERVRRRR